MKRILVTGAAGRVGRCVARRLAREPVALRLLFRSPRAADVPAGCEVCIGDFNDLAQMARAFESVDAVFMYTPAKASDSLFGLAYEAGVRRIVLLSSASVIKVPPGTNPIAERHRSAERAIRATAMQWTFLRPDTMASNCLAWADTIRREGRVHAPYPEATRNPIHEDDIALLAAQALLSDKHVGAAFHLTGPRCLTIREQVDVISARLGTRIDCVETSREEALHAMTSGARGMPDEAAGRLLDYLKKSITMPTEVTDDYRRATGLLPRPFEEWVEDNLHHFRSEEGISRLRAAD